MSKQFERPVLLTVRGTRLPGSLESTRVMHNETAGSPQGVAAARALGDLSHMVYAPIPGVKSGAGSEELLFVDVWIAAKGIMEFFSNERVIQQGTRLFKSRQPTIWKPAIGAYSYSLPIPRERSDRCVGMVRGPVASPESAIEIFGEADSKAQQDARRRGIISHELFIKLNPPGQDGPLELLGLDVWFDAQGMNEHYADERYMSPIYAAFSGPVQASAWLQAPGQWSEW
jgi:hypothetical protein